MQVTSSELSWFKNKYSGTHHAFTLCKVMVTQKQKEDITESGKGSYKRMFFFLYITFFPMIHGSYKRVLFKEALGVYCIRVTQSYM